MDPMWSLLLMFRPWMSYGYTGCKSVLYKIIVTKFFLDYCLNSRVCNYGKRAVIELLRTIIKCFIFIF